MIANDGKAGAPATGDDVLGQLRTASIGMLAQRTDTLMSMQDTRATKDRALARERSRLAARFPADSPRLAELDGRIAESQATSAALTQQVYQAQTPIPTPDAKIWTMFGSVRGKDHVGLPGMKVAFFDAGGGPRTDLGYVCTDENGYFTLRSGGAAINGNTAYLWVFDKAGKIVYRDVVGSTPKAGGLDYREIVIDGNSLCTPPWEPPTVAGSGTTGGGTGSGGTGSGGTGSGTGGGTGSGGTGSGGTGSGGTGGGGDGTLLPGDRGDTSGGTTGTGIDRHLDAASWMVRGTVTDAAGRPVQDVIVTVWDRDLFFDDRLGQARTNDLGEYALRYATEAFRDFFERKPDVYVRVTDEAGKHLAETKCIYRPEAGEVEIIDIRLTS
ncbi:MAG TPA: hypothetical protein VHI13_21280 [Candidatus Kapabacteria bacterium]|nr:hypothetical protein [Candidatus Kapabacteria bacterium]